MKILEKIQELEAKRQECYKQLSEELHLELKPLMEKFTKIESISFMAYTCYWNDGEQCTYGVYLDDCSVAVNGEREIYFLRKNNWTRCVTTGKYMDIPNPDYNEAEGKVFYELLEVLQAIPYSFWLETYGDHQEITITKEGITTEDYTDHE